MKIAVLGGGNGSFAAAGDFALARHEVRLWRRDGNAVNAHRAAGSKIVLKDSNGRLVSIGTASEIHDRLRKRAGYNNLVVAVVVINVVRVPHQLRGLSCNISHRRHIAVRQPGERRDLRVGHSVEGDKLTSLGVVRHRSDIAE